MAREIGAWERSSQNFVTNTMPLIMYSKASVMMMMNQRAKETTQECNVAAIFILLILHCVHQSFPSFFFHSNIAMQIIFSTEQQ